MLSAKLAVCKKGYKNLFSPLVAHISIFKRIKYIFQHETLNKARVGVKTYLFSGEREVVKKEGHRSVGLLQSRLEVACTLRCHLDSMLY